jgi:hypothetical protein
MSQTFLRVSLLSAALMTSTASRAQIPSTSPYVTDVQNEYVQDDTSQGIGNLNMILCVIGGLNPGAMVNTGPYIALVDMNKCNSGGGGGGGGGGSSSAGATNFATAVVDVTRATNADPMIGKVWLTVPDQGGSAEVFAYLSATQSPASAPPYGVFRMDYVGYKFGEIGFNGFVNAQPGTISQYETGPKSSNSAMALTAASTSSGAGTISALGESSFNFAYNDAYFRRSDGTNDQCFDRSKANAQRSVWEYGTYNANDGTRVDLAHPGFQIAASYSGSLYYGFGNYWGVNFDGLDLNTLADAQPIPGLTVSDKRPGNTTSYQLSKVGGKLIQWTQQATTLGALDGIPISFGADLTGLTTGNDAVTGYQNWELQWNASSQTFTVIGTQQCGNNGCLFSPLTPVATVNASAFINAPISGYANSYGGSINIPPTAAAHTSADAVYYYVQATVIPGSASLALHCLNQCPTAVSLAAFASGTAATSPFGNNTGQQWFSAPATADTVSYNFDRGGLEDASGATPVSVVLEQASQYPSGSTYAQNGINTGRLFDTALSGTNCPAGMPAGTVCEPANPATYYTWQTGPQQWNQSLWLTTGTAVVAFDPPQNIAYTVPTGSAYGSYAGLPILLQFNGFGNLGGIPSYCVNPVNNATEDCSTPNARSVPTFSLPDGATMTLPNPSTPLIVKALSAELRLNNLGASATSPCSTMTLVAATLPSGGTHDPSNSADSEYLGTKPLVSSAPQVIDGVVQ